MQRSACVAFAFVISLWATQALAAQRQDPRCSTRVLAPKMARNPLGEVVLDSAVLVKSNDTSPAYCDVRGHIHTENLHKDAEDAALQEKEIQFRVFLPSNWNQKFMMLGCGGFCGSLNTQIGSSERKGYATAATDSGHVSIEGMGASWARNPDGTQNIDRLMNFAHRSIHLVTKTAKNVIKAYYQRTPRLSYFIGGSNGGRQALIEAQRYPDDFDGIISLYPALDLSNLLAFCARNIQAQFPASQKQGVLNPDLLQVLSSFTMAKCDKADGLVDNIISDPLSCDFDATRDIPLCTKEITSNCFSKEQMLVAKAIGGPLIVDGDEVLHEGLVPGYEGAADSWKSWQVSDTAFCKIFSENYLRYFVYNDPVFNLSDFDLKKKSNDLFVSPSGVPFDLLFGAKYPDLTSFKARNGKLIIVQGLADPVTSVRSTLRYYNNLVTIMGGKEKVDDFARVFLVPGLLHGRPVPNHPVKYDAITALEKWRESNIAPKELMGFDGETIADSKITRPLCRYPLKAKYVGSGSINEAKNFLCQK